MSMIIGVALITMQCPECHWDQCPYYRGAITSVHDYRSIGTSVLIRGTTTSVHDYRSGITMQCPEWHWDQCPYYRGAISYQVL